MIRKKAIAFTILTIVGSQYLTAQHLSKAIPLTLVGSSFLANAGHKKLRDLKPLFANIKQIIHNQSLSKSDKVRSIRQIAQSILVPANLTTLAKYLTTDIELIMGMLITTSGASGLFLDLCAPQSSATNS